MPVADWHCRWSIELRSITQEDQATNDRFRDEQAAADLTLAF
jgi:hypothetical protein